MKLLNTGKTDLLDKFVSKRNRPFSAYLKLDKGKVGFEFEVREGKPAAKGGGARRGRAKAKPAAKK